MHPPLHSGYVFSAAARQIDFSNVPGFDPRNLFAVINLTAGQVIYAVGGDGLGYAAVAGTTLTLAFDTSGMADGDSLMVLYEAVGHPLAYASPGAGAASSVKIGQGLLSGGALYNRAAAPRLVRFFDIDHAPVGTNAPTFTDVVPGGGRVTLDYGALGLAFAQGLFVAVTDLNGAAVPSGDVSGVLIFN